MDYESPRLVVREVSELWKIPTTPKKCSGEICQCPPAVKVWKSSWPRRPMPRANTWCRLCFKLLVKQVSVFLHVPNQVFKNLEESISGCHPEVK